MKGRTTTVSKPATRIQITPARHLLLLLRDDLVVAGRVAVVAGDVALDVVDGASLGPRDTEPVRVEAWLQRRALASEEDGDSMR